VKPAKRWRRFWLGEKKLIRDVRYAGCATVCLEVVNPALYIICVGACARVCSWVYDHDVKRIERMYQQKLDECETLRAGQALCIPPLPWWERPGWWWDWIGLW